MNQLIHLVATVFLLAAFRVSQSPSRDVCKAGFELIEKKNYSLGLTDLRKCKAARPRDVAVREALVRGYLEAGKPEAAFREVDGLLALNLATVAECRSLAGLLVMNHQAEEAVRVLDHAQHLDPSSREVLRDLAKANLAARENDRALALLERVPSDRDDWEHEDLLGLAYSRLARPAKASEAFRKAINLDPKQPAPHHDLGVLLLSSSENADDALVELGQAVDLAPDDPQYSLALAQALIDKKRYPVAVEFLNAVGSRFDSLAEYHYTLGLAYYGSRNAEGAIREFSRTIELSPRNEPAHLFLGHAYDFAGQFARAAREYEEVVRLDPSNAAAYNYLAFAEEKLNEPQKSIASLRKSIALAPKVLVTRMNLAQALYKAGRLQEAIEQLKACVKIDPQLKQAYYLLATYSRQLGDTAAADEYLKTFKRLQGEAASTQNPR